MKLYERNESIFEERPLRICNQMQTLIFFNDIVKRQIRHSSRLFRQNACQIELENFQSKKS